MELINKLKECFLGEPCHEVEFTRGLEVAWRSSTNGMKRPSVALSWSLLARRRYLLSGLHDTSEHLIGLKSEAARQIKEGNLEAASFLESFIKTERELREKISGKINTISRLLRCGPGKSKMNDRIAAIKSRGMDYFFGDKKKIHCLWHEDSNPSMQIYRNNLHCFSCGKNVDIIDYVMSRNGISLPAAVKYLENCDGNI